MAHAYALHRPVGRPFAARLYRFRSSAIRGIRMERDAPRWRAIPEARVAAFVAEADGGRRWRYEAPGVWSAPVGPLRALAWWRSAEDAP